MNTLSEFSIQRITKALSLASLSAIILISLLLIVNYIQLKTVSPVEKSTVEKLIKKLEQNPGDKELRQQIRAVDLMSRKAFFTNIWQLHKGGILLLVSVTVLLISLKIFLSYQPKQISQETNKLTLNYWFVKAKERNWLAMGVLFIALSAFTLMFLSKGEYSDFESTQTSNSENSSQQDNKMVTGDKKSSDNKNKNTTDSSKVKKAEEEKDDYPEDKDIYINHPQFRGPFGLGISYQANIPTDWDGASGKNILWKATPALPGLNSPILWDKYLFVSGANATNREVYCYNRLNGQLLWAKPVDNVPGSPAASPKVTDDTGFAAATMTTDGKRVYAIFANGDVICFDFEGKRIWAKNIGVPANHYGHSSSLLMFKDLLIIQYDHSTSRNLIALQAKTGDVKWNTIRPGRISWSSPILVKFGDKGEIILNNDPYVASYDAATGKELWKVECLTGEIGASPAYTNGIVFSANAYAKLSAIQSGSGQIIWESNDYLPDASSPVAWKDYLFISTAAGEVACFDAKKGTVLWNHEFASGFYASPIVVDNKLYIMDRNGVMHIMKADKEFALISEPKIPEKSDCTPAFAYGCIYLRGKQNIYCITGK